MGGPKDVDPPQLLSSDPTDGQKNFKGKVITLNFDEYVKLKDPKEEIIITPSPGANTKYIAKKRSVIIIPENPWTENTTYSVAFRNGIQDINESNAAEDLHLAFSTGPTIDSLTISGTVNEIFKEKPPEKLLVALYQSDTFDIFRHRPIYFTKTNKEGRFSVKNLKEGKYYIYAFEDRNKNTKVDSKTEPYGFIPQALNIPPNNDSIHIPLFHLDARPLKLTSSKHTSTVSIIRFNKSLDSAKLSPSTDKLKYTFGDNTSEIYVYKNFPQSDSMKINIHGVDSLQQKIDTSLYVKFTEGKIPADKFRIGEWLVNLNQKTYELTATTNATKIITKVNTDSIYFQLDSTNYQTAKPGELTFDTLSRKITLKTKLAINTQQKKIKPILLIGKAAFVSIDNDSSKTQDVKIPVLTNEESGIVSIEISTKEKNYEVQMISTDNKTVLSFRNQKKYTFNYVNPAEYKIIVIVDKNNNHRWDAGNFYKKISPEKIILYKTIDNKYTFPVRANWELGPLLITF